MRIGLVVNILNEQYQISVYNGIKKRAHQLGIDLICFQQENIRFSNNNIISRFPDKEYFNLDGIILLTSVVSDSYEINDKNDVEKIWGNLPVISVGQKIEGIASLLVDTDSSMKDLVEHLVSHHNYSKYLFISGAKNHRDADTREHIFKQTLDQYKKQNPEISYVIKRGWFTESAAIQAMNDYYEENPDIKLDAVVCANDNMAIGVYKFLKMNHHNKNVQVKAVTGFDDIPEARFQIPSLTTIHQPLEEIGEESVNYISKLINGETLPDESFVDARMIIRQSCGCKSEQEDTESFIEEMQANYIQSEQLLRMVSHIGQDLNYAETREEMNKVVNAYLNQLDIKNFCVLTFNTENRDLISPLYVRRNGNKVAGFISTENITIGQFYRRFEDLKNEDSDSIVFKYLNAGNEIIGAILYDANEDVLPYLSSIGVNIAQSLTRIHAAELRKKRSEYLEKEVNKRTQELLEANNKRMEVEAEVLRISEIERQRFSTDLHDDICQRLAGISMLCRSYSNQNDAVTKDQMIELAQLISDTLQTTRQYAHNSYPVELESLGMNHSINNLCNSFEKQSGIRCVYEWNVEKDTNFTTIQKLNIFRIIQEALHNVMKHSKAENVKVQVSVKSKKLTLEISDDGCGLGIKSKDGKGGLGLNSMQYRANQIGAAFMIRGNTPKGTVVGVTLDMRESKD